MELKTTRVQVDDGVATIWLHRPQRHNAWTGRMHTEYRWVMAELAADERVRVAIVTGTPPAFCVGADSQALAGHAERGGYDDGLRGELATPGHGVRPEFEHDFSFQFGLPFVTIAAVNGAAAGVGLAVALFCDLRFMAATAKITTAAPKLGLPAENGMSWILPRLVGVTRAADLLLSGRAVTGSDTADWGLWNEVLPDGDATYAAARDYATNLATRVAPSSLRMTKRQLYDDLLTHDVGAALVEARRLLGESMSSADYREGVAALRERRPPRF